MKLFPHIVYHKFRNNSYLEDRYQFHSESALEFLEEMAFIPFVLSTIGAISLRSGTYQLIMDGGKDEFIEQLRLAHLSRTWHWRGMVDDGPHNIALPNCDPFSCGEIEPNSDVDLGSWLEGIYIAMILRDIGAVKVYGEADPEKVVRYGQNKPDPWEIPYIKFLNGIWAFDTNIVTYLKDALRGTEPSLYTPERADWIINILSPVMELWAMVFGEDEARFNAKLLEQQQLRHDWHAALDEETGNSIMEYIDLAALAAVCYAHDKGFKIDVKSDYLPEFLINGDFPKLEWPDPEWKEWPKA